MIFVKTELILVRHGETEWNHSLKFQGQMDISLNERGFKQAKKAADYLSQEKIDVVYSSDLKRAYNTAELIASYHKKKVKIEKGLREINFGEWEGLSYKEIEKEYPILINKWYNDPTSVSPPGGEGLEDFQERIVNSINNILSRHNGERVIMVSHGGSIRVYLVSILSMPLKKYWSLEVYNTGLSIIKFYNDCAILSLFNSTVHLQGGE